MGLFNFGKKKQPFKVRDEYDRLYDTSEPDHPCIRASCTGTMRFEGWCYRCDACDISCPVDDYEAFLKGEITFDDESNMEDLTYEEVYDTYGSRVRCDNPRCRGYIKFRNGQYVCPTCGKELSRSEFFESIGVTPPGPSCSYCDNLYPGCIVCPYGYDVDDD